jgi:hypothetical protein
MVGSYQAALVPPAAARRDNQVAFKEVRHEEAYHDATLAVISDQGRPGSTS